MLHHVLQEREQVAQPRGGEVGGGQRIVEAQRSKRPPLHGEVCDVQGRGGEGRG